MTINCLGKLIDLSSPKVMGILNLTPDSFYDGGFHKSDIEILNHVERLLQEGATFIDVGAYSSKPKAEFVSEKEEIERLLPVLKQILKQFPSALVSIDTFRNEVAKLALDAGAAIINDISAGGLDENMMKTVAQFQVPYIMMHLRGTPQTMHTMTNYENITKEILFYFSEKLALARSYGINDLILDPGFGFAKTTDSNFELLHKLDLFQWFELPLLIGVSRKSMIYKTLKINPEEALNGTSIINTLALNKGANILRVHDVKEAVECITLFEKVQNRL